MRFVSVITAFLLVFLPCSAFAANSTLVDDTIRKAVELPQQTEQAGLIDLLWELRAERGDCTLLVLTHFPQGLGKNVDAALAEVAKQDNGDGFLYVQEQSDFSLEHYLSGLAKTLGKSSEPALPERTPRDWGNTYAYVTTWQIFRPSDKFVTVVFRHDMSGGAAHGNWAYRCLTFHVNTGSMLEFNDIFPDGEASENLLRQRVMQALQMQKKAAGHASEIAEDDMDVNLLRLALTPEGMRVYYAPYEAGSFSEGEYVIDIPRNDLLKMGAAPSLWQET